MIRSRRAAVMLVLVATAACSAPTAPPGAGPGTVITGTDGHYRTTVPDGFVNLRPDRSQPDSAGADSRLGLIGSTADDSLADEILVFDYGSGAGDPASLVGALASVLDSRAELRFQVALANTEGMRYDLTGQFTGQMIAVNQAPRQPYLIVIACLVDAEPEAIEKACDAVAKSFEVTFTDAG